MHSYFATLALAASLLQPSVAQLSGPVGPTTTILQKAAVKICNILDYGGAASITFDNGPALASAWAACKTGGQVYIPEGDYGLSTFVTLNGGSGVSINLEGIIHRFGSSGGNMIFVEHSKDIEIYSANAAGAIQGNGYEFHSIGETGARLFRLYAVDRWSIHDIALVDSPLFHLSIDTCTNGEVYNVVIHGGNMGGLDGIDVWGTNIWIHDVEVSNKDECVTIKNPSTNILVEQIHCNWSGGCAMGSLSTNINISNIEYNNIYTHHSNQMYMIKSNGGNGTVSDIAFRNFVGHSNAYTLDVDTAWANIGVAEGDGITFSNITFDSWTGTCSNGVQRGPVKMLCPPNNPCADMTIDNFHVWTETGDEVYHACYNAYGSGACLNEGTSLTSYTTTQVVTTESAYAFPTMANEITSGFNVSQPIPIPTIPPSFFPGSAPISAILSSETSGSPTNGTSFISSTSSITRTAFISTPLSTSTSVQSSFSSSVLGRTSTGSASTLSTKTRSATSTFQPSSATSISIGSGTLTTTSSSTPWPSWAPHMQFPPNHKFGENERGRWGLGRPCRKGE